MPCGGTAIDTTAVSCKGLGRCSEFSRVVSAIYSQEKPRVDVRKFVRIGRPGYKGGSQLLPPEVQSTQSYHVPPPMEGPMGSHFPSLSVSPLSLSHTFCSQ